MENLIWLEKLFAPFLVVCSDCLILSLFLILTFSLDNHPPSIVHYYIPLHHLECLYCLIVSRLPHPLRPLQLARLDVDR